MEPASGAGDGTCKMIDNVYVSDRVSEAMPVADVAFDQLDVVAQRAAVRLISYEAPNVIRVATQARDEMLPDESRAAGYQNLRLHRSSI